MEPIKDLGKFVHGDTGRTIKNRAVDVDGVVVDLTGSTIAMKIQAYDWVEAEPTSSDITTITCTVDPATATLGYFTYLTDSIGALEVGTYIVEFEISAGGGSKLTLPLIKLEVIGDLPLS